MPFGTLRGEADKEIQVRSISWRISRQEQQSHPGCRQLEAPGHPLDQLEMRATHSRSSLSAQSHLRSLGTAETNSATHILLRLIHLVKWGTGRPRMSNRPLLAYSVVRGGDQQLYLRRLLQHLSQQTDIPQQMLDVIHT